MTQQQQLLKDEEVKIEARLNDSKKKKICSIN
jgi:hypothetical protein